MDKCEFLGQLAEKLRPGSDEIDFAALQESEKIFLAVWDLDSEVNGGGFDQFLRCCDSSIIAHSPGALKEIGAAACGLLAARAIQLIEPLPPSADERFERLDDIGEEGEDELIELDEAYDICSNEIIDLLYAYVLKHPQVFGAVPE